jgi:hypothetical protein
MLILCDFLIDWKDLTLSLGWFNSIKKRRTSLSVSNWYEYEASICQEIEPVHETSVDEGASNQE